MTMNGPNPGGLSSLVPQCRMNGTGIEVLSWIYRIAATLCELSPRGEHVYSGLGEPYGCRDAVKGLHAEGYIEVSSARLALFVCNAFSVLHYEAADCSEGVFVGEEIMYPTVCDVFASFPGSIVEIHAWIH